MDATARKPLQCLRSHEMREKKRFEWLCPSTVKHFPVFFFFCWKVQLLLRFQCACWTLFSEEMLQTVLSMETNVTIQHVIATSAGVSSCNGGSDALLQLHQRDVVHKQRRSRTTLLCVFGNDNCLYAPTTFPTYTRTI